MYDKNIIRWLKNNLSQERFNHTLAVTALAEELALKHKCDPAQTRLAGLLHDAAKSMSVNDLINYAAKFKLNIPNRTFILHHAPELLHSYVSAALAVNIFGVRNREILDAIANHTIGACNLSLLDKIIYIADTSSTDRRFKEAERIRRTAVKNIETALIMALEAKIMYVIKNRFPIHPDTTKIWNTWVNRDRLKNGKNG